MELYLILTTTPTKQEAKSLAQALLQRSLIACAQWRKIRSLYRFQGSTYCEKEYLLTLKTTASALPAARELLLTLHSYEVPQYVALRIDESSEAYQDFVRGAIGG